MGPWSMFGRKVKIYLKWLIFFSSNFFRYTSCPLPTMLKEFECLMCLTALWRWTFPQPCCWIWMVLRATSNAKLSHQVVVKMIASLLLSEKVSIGIIHDREHNWPVKPVLASQDSIGQWGQYLPVKKVLASQDSIGQSGQFWPVKTTLASRDSHSQLG